LDRVSSPKIFGRCPEPKIPRDLCSGASRRNERLAGEVLGFFSDHSLMSKGTGFRNREALAKKR
jgi:hypothetical protein